MRLTLRTLLAFLDHTLSKEDEQALAEKVESSAIATELAERIRAVTANPILESAPPDAVGPTDDANAIAEYLDDTLAPELTADVERRCVASSVQLSEVAACHQILAIVLGEPAEVPQDLRQRVYGLGQNIPKAATGTGAPGSDPMAQEVTPVGPEDSGVAEATTRLAAEPDLNDTISAASKTIRDGLKSEPHVDSSGRAMAGARSRERLESIGPVLSGGRPSRLAPAIVALGLAAAFLFVVTQAFGPLLEYNRNRQANADETQVEDAPSPGANLGSTDERSNPTNNAATDSTPLPPSGNSAESAESSADENAGASDSLPNVDDATNAPSDPSGTETSAEAGVGPKTFPTPPPVEPDDSAIETDANPPTTAQDQTTGDDNNPLDRAVAAAKQAPPLGIVELDGGLLMRQDAETGMWNRLLADAELDSGDVIACGPTFNARVLLEGGLELTLFGPSAVRVSKLEAESPDSPQVALAIDFGRVTLAATSDPLTIAVATPAASGRCALTEPGAVAALSVAFRRAPGSDLLNAASSVAVMDVLAVQNRTDWTVAGSSSSPISISTGQACRFERSRSPQMNLNAALPAWTQPGAERVSTAVQGSHQGLAEFTSEDIPLELALRNAVNFRDPEVSSLAARALVQLGMLDILFGPEGVLSNPAIRNHWPLLVGDLRAFINRGPGAAQMTGAAIGALEGEQSGGKIWALLIGFSPEQIERGADSAILELMDDESMAVRVIATETLRHVTGETNDYRADYESATRRGQALKELQRQLRRNQIRWSDAEAGTEGLPTIDGSDQLL